MNPLQLDTDWEKKTKKFMQQFIRPCSEGLKCEGCKYDMHAIIEHISSLLASQQARMVEKIEKSPFEMHVDDYLPLVKAWKGGYDVPFDDGYKKGKADAIAIIKGEDKE